VVNKKGIAADVATDVAEATPKVGVMKTGDVFMANVVPVPVCAAIDVALPTDVMGPVRLALVVTFPDVKLAPVPVKFVPASDGVSVHAPVPAPVPAYTSFKSTFGGSSVSKSLISVPDPVMVTFAPFSRPLKRFVVELYQVSPLEGVDGSPACEPQLRPGVVPFGLKVCLTPSGNTIAPVIVGVAIVGEVPPKTAPDPDSPVTAAKKLADEGVAKNVATLAPNPLTPVETFRRNWFVSA